MSKPDDKKAQDRVKQIKELAKKPHNKKCFNCLKDGPQNSVCLTLNTFVCSSCAGLHRNFTHKVKTITMSDFSVKEVEALEQGGNKVAGKIWLGKLNEDTRAALNVNPDDPKSVQDFMTRVYTKKEWYKEPGSSSAAEKAEKPAAAAPSAPAASRPLPTPAPAKVESKQPEPPVAKVASPRASPVTVQPLPKQAVAEKPPQNAPPPDLLDGIDFDFAPAAPVKPVAAPAKPAAAPGGPKPNPFAVDDEESGEETDDDEEEEEEEESEDEFEVEHNTSASVEGTRSAASSVSKPVAQPARLDPIQLAMERASMNPSPAVTAPKRSPFDDFDAEPAPAPGPATLLHPLSPPGPVPMAMPTGGMLMPGQMQMMPPSAFGPPQPMMMAPPPMQQPQPLPNQPRPPPLIALIDFLKGMLKDYRITPQHLSTVVQQALAAVATPEPGANSFAAQQPPIAMSQYPPGGPQPGLAPQPPPQFRAMSPIPGAAPPAPPKANPFDDDEPSLPAPAPLMNGAPQQQPSAFSGLSPSPSQASIPGGMNKQASLSSLFLGPAPAQPGSSPVPHNAFSPRTSPLPTPAGELPRFGTNPPSTSPVPQPWGFPQPTAQGEATPAQYGPPQPQGPQQFSQQPQQPPQQGQQYPPHFHPSMQPFGQAPGMPPGPQQGPPGQFNQPPAPQPQGPPQPFPQPPQPGQQFGQPGQPQPFPQAPQPGQPFGQPSQPPQQFGQGPPQQAPFGQQPQMQQPQPNQWPQGSPPPAFPQGPGAPAGQPAGPPQGFPPHMMPPHMAPYGMPPGGFPQQFGQQPFYPPYGYPPPPGMAAFPGQPFNPQMQAQMQQQQQQQQAPQPQAPPPPKEWQQPAPKIDKDDPADMFAFANPLLKT